MIWSPLHDDPINLSGRSKLIVYAGNLGWIRITSDSHDAKVEQNTLLMGAEISDAIVEMSKTVCV